MQDLFPVQQINEIHVVDSRMVADELGVDHSNLVETIKAYQETIEKEFGLIIPFETEKLKGVGRPKVFCYLTEDQALFVGSLSRNSENVVRFKVKLIKSFQAVRKAINQVVQISREQKIAEALLLTQEIIAEKDAEIKQLKPKAEYTEKVLLSESTLTISEIASQLNMSAVALNRLLCQRGVQYKHRDHYILYARYKDKGYAKTNTYAYPATDNKIKTRDGLVWTERGRAFIHSLVNSALSFNKAQEKAPINYQ